MIPGSPPKVPFRVAHRGMPRRARENTLAGFALALDSGADGIELDVHATADGDVVVHHDPTLASGQEIAMLTLAEVRHLDPHEGSERIPTLREVCALVSGRAELFVEIKGYGIEDLVTAALDGYGGATAIHSFDRDLMLRLSTKGVAYRLGLLSDAPETDIAATMARHRALDLWPHHPIVTRALVEAVHAMGGRVIPWTVNHVAEARRLAAFGVDGLCSDDVTTLPMA